ncbi:MAG TPA: response regulator [Candidatus Saccharibacteria bacterium]|jgi:DNA-binding response OmpR family regulator|nr:response regulator [Candidatus Saccharibacteria bacterium]HMT56301.1 response regulator [Candidatus Saccharibacteria bacterium]
MEEYVNNGPLKIVIVEDNVALAEIYKTRLDIIGYECHVAYDGQAALSLIERVKPALVLLDLMMPVISGDEVLRRMRATDWGKDIRVYIISNLNEVDAPKDLRELGIEGYTVKANLSDDDIDKLVDKILTPKDQEESTSLEEPAV